MPKELREDVVRTIKDQKIEFIHLWFTDVLGFLKSFTIDIEELDMAMSEGMGFDGSSILGFARIQESDMVALPDPTTLQIMPWRTGGQLVATMFCDIVTPDGRPYEADPRYVLRRNVQRAKDLGFDFEKTNPNGSGISLGHPVGATGTILAVKALYELERIQGRICIVEILLCLTVFFKRLENISVLDDTSLQLNDAVLEVLLLRHVFLERGKLGSEFIDFSGKPVDIFLGLRHRPEALRKMLEPFFVFRDGFLDGLFYLFQVAVAAEHNVLQGRAEVRIGREFCSGVL